MRQYFYLVVARYDESCYPKKVFLQEHDAITWGRREATKCLQLSDDPNWSFELYKQEISRNAQLLKVKDLKPYPMNKSGDIISIPRQPDDDIFGADYDIDKERL